MHTIPGSRRRERDATQIILVIWTSTWICHRENRGCFNWHMWIILFIWASTWICHSGFTLYDWFHWISHRGYRWINSSTSQQPETVYVRIRTHTIPGRRRRGRDATQIILVILTSAWICHRENRGCYNWHIWIILFLIKQVPESAIVDLLSMTDSTESLNQLQRIQVKQFLYFPTTRNCVSPNKDAHHSRPSEERKRCNTNHSVYLKKAPQSVIEKTEGVTIDIFKSFCLFEQVPESVIVDLPSMTDSTESVTEDTGESIPLFLNNQK